MARRCTVSARLLACCPTEQPVLEGKPQLSTTVFIFACPDAGAVQQPFPELLSQPWDQASPGTHQDGNELAADRLGGMRLPHSQAHKPVGQHCSEDNLGIGHGIEGQAKQAREHGQQVGGIRCAM